MQDIPEASVKRWAWNKIKNAPTDICPSGRCLLAAATAAVVIVISAAAEKNDDKDYNPETVVVAEATVVTKAAHIYTSFLSIGKPLITATVVEWAVVVAVVWTAAAT